MSENADASLLCQDVETGSGAASINREAPQTSTLTCNLDFHVDCKLKDGSTGKLKLLDQVVTRFSPGTCTAVMGPSGAGKTTLLNSLCGRASYGTVSGAILENGCELDPDEFKQRFTYVPQDDILWAALTPRQLLDYTAQLRFNEPPEARCARVDSVLAALGLSHRADVLIGDVDNPSLSGGQRKRVSIAVELLADRPVLFLDEPTSGLDSSSAHEVCQLLCNLAKTQNKTIVCTIHQPTFASLCCFSNLLVLAKGQVVYDQCPLQLNDYMRQLGAACPVHQNPIDYFMEQISSGTSAIDWALEWKSNVTHPHQDGQFQPTPTGKSYAISRINQTAVLLKRSFHLWFYDPTMLRAVLPPQLLIHLVMGLSFFQPGYTQTLANGVFLLTAETFMANMMTTLVVIPAEKVVVKREYSNGTYSLSSYWLSRVIQAIVSIVGVNTIVLPITYFLMGLPTEVATYGAVWLATGLVAATAAVLALLIGCSVPSAQVAVQRVPGPVILVMLYTGLLIPKSDMKDWFVWIYHINVLQYGYKLIMYAICSGHGDDAEQILDYLSIKHDELRLAWIVMVGALSAIMFAGYYLAKRNFA